MTWKPILDCDECGEENYFHARGKCRFEQDGWIDVKDSLPGLRRRVLARRNKEIFVGMMKRDLFSIESLKNPDAKMWVTPYEQDGKVIHGIVTGITHWRELRDGEPEIEKSGRLT